MAQNRVKVDACMSYLILEERCISGQDRRVPYDILSISGACYRFGPRLGLGMARRAAKISRCISLSLSPSLLEFWIVTITLLWLW